MDVQKRAYLIRQRQDLVEARTTVKTQLAELQQTSGEMRQQIRLINAELGRLSDELRDNVPR